MSFDGVSIVLPVGLRGFSGSKNPSKLGPDQLSSAESVDLDGGVLVKDGGALKLNSTALGAPSKVLAGINWSPTTSLTDDVVALGDGTVRRDQGSGTFPTTLVSALGINEEPPPFFVTAGGEAVGSTRKLFLFSGSHQVQMLSGVATTMAAIGTPPADWATSFPLFGVQHVGRLWGGGNASDPHRLYYSQPGDHTNFTGTASGNISVYPGEGSLLVGGISFRGLLFVWKYPFGIYAIDTRDPSTANWSVSRVTSATGGVNAQTIVQIENDVLYLDAGGNIHVISATNDFGDVSTANISESGRGQGPQLGAYIRSNVNLTAIRRAVGAWYAPKRKAWFMFPRTGNTTNDLRLTIDFADAQAGPRFLPSTRDVGISLWMRTDTAKVRRPVLGDAVGFVRLMDRDARNKDAAPYTMSFDTSNTDFSFASPDLGGVMKQGAFLEITADLIQNTTLQITPSWDDIPQAPIVFVLGVAGVGLDSFILDTHALAGSGIISDRKQLPGSGRRLRLNVIHTQNDVELRLSEFRIGFTIGDERIRSG